MTDQKTDKDEVEKALAPISQRNLPILSERFQPRNLTELMKWAKLVVASGLAPKGMNEAGVVICVQMGAELKISPAQAIQNIALINGRPGIWGDLGLAIFKRDADYKAIEEDAPDKALEQGYGRCKVTMKDGSVIERRFSVEDAKRAKLWGKDSPWSTYPGRMLMWRARWWAMRDADGGVFKGCSSAEEQRDVIDSTFEASTIERPKAKDDTGNGFNEIEEFVDTVGKGPKPGAGGRPAPAPLPAIDNPYVGQIAALTKKTGKKGNKEWTLYRIKLVDGQEFSTFDKKIAENARELGQGVDVKVRWEQKGQYRTAMAVDPALPEQSDATEPPETEPVKEGEPKEENLFDTGAAS